LASVLLLFFPLSVRFSLCVVLSHMTTILGFLFVYSLDYRFLIYFERIFAPTKNVPPLCYLRIFRVPASPKWNVPTSLSPFSFRNFTRLGIFFFSCIYCSSFIFVLICPASLSHPFFLPFLFFPPPFSFSCFPSPLSSSLIFFPPPFFSPLFLSFVFFPLFLPPFFPFFFFFFFFFSFWFILHQIIRLVECCLCGATRYSFRDFD